ncbi:MAG: ATP-dependent helicase [Terriglobales bacterium]
MADTVALSAEQLRVVASKNARIQVIACAGSGKTETMARRIVRLLAEGAEPAAIVAFTFTERAAAGLKNRVLQRYAEARGEAECRKLGPLSIGTIHAYCFRLLQEHAPHFSGFDLADEHRLAALLSREYRRLKLDGLRILRHWTTVRDFLHNAEAVENELIPEGSLSGPFAGCYREFCRRLERYRLLTYGRIITQAVALLEDATLAAAVRGGLRHLIVDEYQDVNPAQEKLITLLAAPPVQLCVVGDDDQAIYQWRGSDVANITEFAQRYPGCDRFPLAINRRSTRAIITAANRFVPSIGPRLDKDMRPAEGAADGLAPVCWTAANGAAEAEEIAAQIERLHNAGYAYREIAVLFRSVRTSARPLIDALTKRGILPACGGRTGLFQQPEARLLGQTYAWLTRNKWRSEEHGAGSEVSLPGLLADYSRAFGLGSEAQRSLRERLEQWRSEAVQERREGNLVGEYYQLLNVLGVVAWNLEDSATATRMGVLARFSGLLADFEHMKRRARFENGDGGEQYRGGQSGGLWFYRQLFSYMQYYALGAYEDFAGEESLGQDAVNLLTVHQAKGLEWPVVFVPSLTARRFPSSRTNQRQNWLAPLTEEQRRRYEGSDTDERRLFYVALTRAREALYLSTFDRTARNQAKPSPFFAEMAGDTLACTPLPLPAAAARHQPGPTEPAELAFSDLALYERCPKAYRLRNLLGFQPKLARELGYGRAVHSVLRAMADLAQREGRAPSEAEAEEILKQEFYLPYANAAALPPMRRAAQALVTAYRQRFGEDLLRTWDTERPLTLAVDGARIQGRADVILDRESGEAGALALADYKTAADDSLELHAFQLAVYAAAARDEGLNVRAAYLHELSTGLNASAAEHEIRRAVPVGPAEAQAARAKAGAIVGDISARRFPPRPAPATCGQCDVRPVCGDAATADRSRRA